MDDIAVDLNVSNFSRVSPVTATSDLTSVTQMISTFLIGPQFTAQKDASFVDVFAPCIHIKTKEGKLEKFRMFTYLGYKTMFVMLLKPETKLTLSKLKSLYAYLNR